MCDVCNTKPVYCRRVDGGQHRARARRTALGGAGGVRGLPAAVLRVRREHLVHAHGARLRSGLRLLLEGMAQDAAQTTTCFQVTLKLNHSAHTTFSTHCL